MKIMENREITLADIFLDVLSKSQDKGAKLMAERIKAAIKSPEILELVNICVINALGFKSKISSKTVDDAIDGIIVLYTLKLTAALYRMMIKIEKRIHTNSLQKVSVKY